MENKDNFGPEVLTEEPKSMSEQIKESVIANSENPELDLAMVQLRGYSDVTALVVLCSKKTPEEVADIFKFISSQTDVSPLRVSEFYDVMSNQQNKLTQAAFEINKDRAFSNPNRIRQ
jgi:hypothetical protein